MIFLGITQWCLTCVEYVLLFSEFHDVKTETSISWKELFDKHCPLVQRNNLEKVETYKFNFYLNKIKV